MFGCHHSRYNVPTILHQSQGACNVIAITEKKNVAILNSAYILFSQIVK